MLLLPVALPSGTTVLTDATHYFASQTISGCESVSRLDVTVAVITAQAPTGNTPQTFCSTASHTVADLTTTTGTNIKWYAGSTGGVALAGTTVLTDATHYFASQTTSGCESVSRLDVTVSIIIAQAPT